MKKKAFESLGPKGSAVSDLPGCLKPAQVNIRKGELPMLTSCRRLCFADSAGSSESVRQESGKALLPSAEADWLLSVAAGALRCSWNAAGSSISNVIGGRGTGWHVSLLITLSKAQLSKGKLFLKGKNDSQLLTVWQRSKDIQDTAS